jgi:hypothetical protein
MAQFELWLSVQRNETGNAVYTFPVESRLQFSSLLKEWMQDESILRLVPAARYRGGIRFCNYESPNSVDGGPSPDAYLRICFMYAEFVSTLGW